ncbi:Histone-lysine N-methyltransferase SETMAR, partial [Dufourea novaeangliae]
LSNMESEKQHFRHILLFYYRKGKTAVQARKKLSDVYGEDVLTERQCQNWFAKFRSGNFDVADARSGRPVEADEDTIKALIDANWRITTREIAEKLNLSNLTVHDHLKRLELINGKGVVFHQDNARPHTSLVTRQKLLQLGWDILPHPPYSPDLEPSDYYLFRSLQNFVDGKTFTSNEEVKNHMDQFFASKEYKFYERGIMLLPE